MNNAKLINQSSGKVEYYTPPNIIKLVHKMFNKIDLDPASSPQANKIVKADMFYTEPSYYELPTKNDRLPTRFFTSLGGLTQGYVWYGNVWLNHPFSKGENVCKTTGNGCTKLSCYKRGWHLGTKLPSNADWVNKMIEHYENGSITQGLMITYASTSETWFKPLLKYPKCWIYGRTNYIDGNTMKVQKGVTKGSVITYFGNDLTKFNKIFSLIGSCHAPIQ